MMVGSWQHVTRRACLFTASRYYIQQTPNQRSRSPICRVEQSACTGVVRHLRSHYTPVFCKFHCIIACVWLEAMKLVKNTAPIHPSGSCSGENVVHASGHCSRRRVLYAKTILVELFLLKNPFSFSRAISPRFFWWIALVHRWGWHRRRGFGGRCWVPG